MLTYPTSLRNAALACFLSVAGTSQANWHYYVVPAPGPVTAIERGSTEALISIGSHWYRLSGNSLSLLAAPGPVYPARPTEALPDGRIVVGTGVVARVWLANPTSRYRHGILGDAIEASSIVIELRDHRRGVVTTDGNAVFEDLLPRIASLNGSEMILVVKSYLDRGSALAVIDPKNFKIIAETPPIGKPHAWLNPAGVADYNGDGSTDIAIVRQPHVVGRIELWSWRNQTLVKVAETNDVSNHVIGSRALEMSVTADFDGDNHPDLALPSFDRFAIRIIAFHPKIRDIARIQLPARVTTNVVLVAINGHPAIVVGLENGQIVVIQKTPAL